MHPQSTRAQETVQARKTDPTTTLCKTQSVVTSGGFQLCQLCILQSLSKVTKHITENSFLKRSFLGCSTASFQKLCRHGAPSGCCFGTRARVGPAPSSALPGPGPHEPCPAQPAMDTELRDTANPCPLCSVNLWCPQHPPAMAATPQLCCPVLHSALPHTLPRPVAAFTQYY